MRIRIIPAIIILSLLAVVATACSVAVGAQPGPSLGPALTAVASPAPAATEAQAAAQASSAFALAAETRSDSQGSVTVEVTPAGGADGTLIFNVTMNTHSIELDTDMARIATLRDDQGRIYAVEGWDGAAGGHHREGMLTFEAPTGPAPKSLELNLSGIGGVPNRLFRWDVK